MKVNAFGTRRFYTPDHQLHGERCLTCQYKSTCKYAMDIETEADGFYKKIYLDVEDGDGYIRDRCIFSEEIDIEDTVALNVSYKSGTVMTYSLNAHAPFEGMKIVINGSEGVWNLKVWAMISLQAIPISLYGFIIGGTKKFLTDSPKQLCSLKNWQVLTS